VSARRNRSKVVDTMAAVCSEGASHLGHHGGQLPERRAAAAGQPLQCVLEGVLVPASRRPSRVEGQCVRERWRVSVCGSGGGSVCAGGVEGQL
jgi:hypothetical protein